MENASGASDEVLARANAAREKIMAEIEGGRFEMSRDVGYLMKGAGDRCVGCALGALAFTLCGMERLPAGYQGVDKCREACASTEQVTLEDVRQMEMGYEGWDLIGVRGGNFSRADTQHPFHQLGAELRAHANDDYGFEPAEDDAESEGED